MRTLPSKFRVTNIREYITRITAYVFDTVLVSIEECTDFLVTKNTPRCTYFKVFKEFNILHEIFIRNHPSQTDRTEETPTMTFSKARRTITTESTVNEVFLFIVITSLSEVRVKGLSRLVRLDIRHFNCVTKFETVRTNDHVFTAGSSLAIYIINFVSQESVEAMI